MSDEKDIRDEKTVLSGVAGESHKTAPRLWKWLGVATAILSIVMMLVLFLVWHAPQYDAYVGKPFVVKFEIADLRKSAITRAAIHLPDGVYFDTEQYPELKSQKSLTLAWSNRDQNQFVPFVVNSTVKGLKTIVVDFYDDANRLVGSKHLNVNLLLTVQTASQG